jgi:hypothetical protein
VAEENKKKKEIVANRDKVKTLQYSNMVIAIHSHFNQIFKTPCAKIQFETSLVRAVVKIHCIMLPLTARGKQKKKIRVEPGPGLALNLG